jgi:hypothetical protein
MSAHARGRGRSTNQKALEKVSTDDLSPGGILPRDMWEEFYTQVTESSDLLSMVRTEEIGRKSTRIPKLLIGERKRQGQDEGTKTDKASVSTDYVDIDAEKGAVYWDLTKETVENNPEREQLASRVMNLMTNQFSADTQDLAINGDESATGWVTQNTGYLALADQQGAATYYHDSAGDGTGTAQAIDNTMFHNMIQSMPNKFLERTTPRFLMNKNQLQEYRHFLTGEYSDASFSVLMSDNELTPFNYDVVGLANFPANRAMFTDTENLIYALFRETEIEVLQESDDILEEDLYRKYGIRAVDDFAIEDADAMVVADGLQEPAVSP